MASQFTATELESMELVYEGGPYVGNAQPARIDVELMETVYEGGPFVVSQSAAAAPPSGDLFTRSMMGVGL